MGPRAATRLALSELELLRRPRTDFDVLVVGYPGHFDMPAAQRIAAGRPIVFNPLVSLEDTMVGDRRLVRSRSPIGKALHAIDRYAFRHADLVVADTAAHGRYLVEHFDLAADRVDVCFVGAEDDLFTPETATRRALHGALRREVHPAPRCRRHPRGSAPVPRHRVQDRRLGPAGRPALSRVAECALGPMDRVSQPTRRIPCRGLRARHLRAYREGRAGDPEQGIPGDGHGDAARDRGHAGGARASARRWNALLVPLGDADALALALHRLAEDERLRRRVAENGRTTYLEHASEPVLGKRWRALLERLLD